MGEFDLLPGHGRPGSRRAPTGFNAVLTRQQCKGVVDFARAVKADLMISVAVSDGAWDEKGVWTPDQARALFACTKSIGGKIAAVEFMNEPNVANHGGAPQGYDATAYARDIAVFRPFLKQAALRPAQALAVLPGVGRSSDGSRRKYFATAYTPAFPPTIGRPPDNRQRMPPFELPGGRETRRGVRDRLGRSDPRRRSQ